MKHIKAFPIFESHSISLNQERFLNMAISENNLETKWVQNPETGKVTTLGHFDGSQTYLGSADKRRTRDIFQSLSFDVAEGDFDVARMFLDTMSGFPAVVEGDLIASHNDFLTAAGAPKMIHKNAELQENSLISLEGLENTVIKGNLWVSENWIRSPFLKDDLEEAKRLGTWVPSYLDILSGETPFTSLPNRNQQFSAKTFILETKTTKAKMEEAIRLAPSQMKVALSRKRDMPQKLQDLLPMLDAPSDFWEDSDLMRDLSDVGL
jgi:hypothetical protein